MLSASCTTGWLDWIHGELWLADDGLLRITLDLKQTRKHGAGRTASGQMTRSFSDTEIEDLLTRDRRNLWVPAKDITAADLRAGRLNGRLSLALADGSKIKLLWLRADHPEQPLQAALKSWGIAH